MQALEPGTMNESASNTSLASSTSGKPSTANSTGSTNPRKTRTIIVARSVPDAPVSSAVARGKDRSTSLSRSASTASATSVVVTPVANLPHVRDARSGRLAPYAALGGEEDVERFDQFLMEQRGQPNASEIRAASASPQHMLASMKRKTMSLLQMNLDGSGPNDLVKVEDVAMDQQMKAELEKDAVKRREEAVARRRWLKSLPIHERLAQQRQQKTLRRWRQVNRDWESFKARAARRLGKPEKELVMSRASGYREQREMLDALQKARPLADKVGGDIWLVSLRNEGTRFVPVGNIFSGLFCPIRESTRLGPRIRRPLDYLHGEDDKSSKPLSILEKRSLTLLARKKWRLRKQLEVLLPHEVQRSASSHLTVETMDLFAWAAGTVVASGRGSESEEGSVKTYVDDDDISSHRRRSLRLSLSQASMNFPRGEELEQEEEEEYAGPSLRIVSVDDTENSMNEATGEDVGVSSDGMACLSPLRLSFYTSVREQQQRTLAVTNNGSTIVHFQWWRGRFGDEEADLTTHLRGHRTRKEEQDLESHTSTSISRPGGTLLPGETYRFVFTFQSSQAGVFLEKWLLDADPRPRIQYGTRESSPPEKDAEDELVVASSPLPVEVRLSCTAVDNFAPWKRRRAQLKRVEQREIQFFAALLIDEILDAVAPPEPVTFSALAPRADVAKFYACNKYLKSDVFSNVYYSPELVRDCFELYQKARQVLLALTPEPSADDQQETETAECGEGADKEKNEVGETSSRLSSSRNVNVETVGSVQDGGNGAKEHALAVAMTRLVVEWDWRLETLRDVCKAADAAQYAKIKRLTRQLKRESEELEDEEDEDDEYEDEDEGEDVDAGDGAEEDGEGSGSRPKVVRLSRQELRARERRARHQELEEEIAKLHPHLKETFDAMCFTACVAPYSTARLEERLYERIGDLCSETPVVCEIVKSTHSSDDKSVTYAATIEDVGKLLMRAIDEAVEGDMDHQAQFEQARRQFQGMWLRDKLGYDSLLQWLANHPSLLPLASSSSTTSVASTDNDDSEAKTKGKAESPALDSSGVLLLHVDLDLAPWFALVKAGKGASAPTGETIITPRVEQALSWRFSSDLAQHETYVPPKVAQAVDALNKLLVSVASAEACGVTAIHTVVLVSELSRPPVTKPMHKLLRNATLAELKSLDPAPEEPTGESARSTARSTMRVEEDDEEAEAKAMELSLQRLAPQLSLKSVAPVVQRAAERDVVFCSTLEELEGQVKFSRKEMLASGSPVVGKTAEAKEDARVSEAEAEDPDKTRASPRILLLEHVAALGRDLLNGTLRPPETASSKPGTPAPPEPQKGGTGAAKKGVPASSRKPSTPLTPSGAGSTSANGSTIVSSREARKAELESPEVLQKSMTLLRDRFARMFSACVLDSIPMEPCGRAFSFAQLADEREGGQLLAPPVPPTFAGASLLKEFGQWSAVLQPVWPQPSLSEASKPRVVSAIVGGRQLESKLRLIDSLLEIASEIFFVGEVAMSLYRVLHAKQQRQQEREDRREEIDDGDLPNDEDLELDAEESNAEEPNEEEEALDEAIPEEEEPNDDGLDKEATGEKLPDNGTSPLGIWDLLVPAVEKLQQKASRKCVRLLLPVDWIVGETPLEEQEPGAGIEEEDDDDEDEEEDEDEEDEDDGEDGAKKGSKRRMSQELKNARRKPLVEPDEADFLELQKQSTYEGERAHVVLDHTVSRASSGSIAGWRTFRNVSAHCLAHARVADGKPGVLSSLWSDAADAEAEDADEAEGSGETGEEGAAHITPPPPRFEFEWTFRALDVGPLAMGSLASQLKLVPSEALAAAPTEQRVIILNGVCGAVEFREFSGATKQLITLLQSHAASSPHDDSVLVAGLTTVRWLQRLEADQHTKAVAGQGTSGTEAANDGTATNEAVSGDAVPAATPHKLVDGRVMRNAPALKHLLAAKPYPLLTSLASTNSM